MKYIDMHCDTISEIWYSRLRKENQTLRKNNFMIDLERLKRVTACARTWGFSWICTEGLISRRILLIRRRQPQRVRQPGLPPPRRPLQRLPHPAEADQIPRRALPSPRIWIPGTPSPASYRFSRRRSLQTPISFPRSPMPRRSSQMTRLAACPLFCPLKRAAAARALSST